MNNRSSCNSATRLSFVHFVVPLPTSQKGVHERDKKRMEKDDPIAIFNLGNYYQDGRFGYTQDCRKALELYHRAAELGDAFAYASIGYAYNNGEGVE